MIDRIFIKNSPTFKSLELDLKMGFNVISGASGSGKSVFLESILAIFGLKEPNADLVEADITIKDIDKELESLGILSEDKDLLTISIKRLNGMRYFINNQAVSKKKVNELTSKFAKYISAKNASELESEHALNVLDSLIATKTSDYEMLLENYKQDYKDYKLVLKELEVLREEEQNIANLKEFANFEIQKIEAINPKVGEYEELLSLKKKLSFKDKILSSAQPVLHTLDGLDSVVKFCENVGIETSAFLESATELRVEIERAIDEYENLELDTEKTLTRLEALGDLKRRYGSIEEALSHLNIQKQNLDKYNNISFNIESMQKKLSTLDKALKDKASKISALRKASLPSLSDLLTSYAKSVHLDKIELRLEKASLNTQGEDMLYIFLNKTDKQNLSSGEYNRLRLCMLCASTSIDKSKADKGEHVLVLDEIDANLSGVESQGVAALLKTLSTKYQIFAISHQPHMPLLSDSHYKVLKNKDNSEIKLLDFEGKVDEIARMISGDTPSKEALEFARKSLGK
ncbi:hypothetical protein BKH43_05630 [Helicobacter sp. 13S00401-1]|uniref:DNA recombination protein RecN n=1 Tax=Helicobacter sp. 13S00401-1 TaxID=1905758 RepID=UPI000BA69A42|nr:DNA recombination protein RecN [Helicobacter sp. 13S00401-1]PAF50213.1 hypothetical protein BKH43_05630 [Helicobacter sp. 13S00401-1]